MVQRYTKSPELPNNSGDFFENHKINAILLTTGIYCTRRGYLKRKNSITPLTSQCKIAHCYNIHTNKHINILHFTIIDC